MAGRKFQGRCGPGLSQRCIYYWRDRRHPRVCFGVVLHTR